MDTPASSVLGRKTVAGKQLKEARAMSVPKALRLSISKSADTLFELALAVIGATQSVMGQGDLCKLFSQDKLMLLLDGPNGRPGAALLDPAFVSGLVQQQTMGHVTAAQDDERPMTRTDAAMTAPLLDDVFARVTELLETEAEKSILRDFQFGAQVLDPRLIGLSLEENEYHVLRLTLDMAAGTRQGDVLLAFPAVTTSSLETTDAQASQDKAKGLHDTVMAVKPELDAVLCKLRVPLRDLQTWAVGTQVPVERGALDDTSLHAQTGRKLGVGKLGQKAGFRALRLIQKNTRAYSGPDRRGMQALLDEDGQNTPASIGETAAADPGYDLDATADFAGVELENAQPVQATATNAPESDVDPVASASFDDDLPDLPPLDFDADTEDMAQLQPQSIPT